MYLLAPKECLYFDGDPVTDSNVVMFVEYLMLCIASRGCGTVVMFVIFTKCFNIISQNKLKTSN